MEIDQNIYKAFARRVSACESKVEKILREIKFYQLTLLTHFTSKQTS